MRKKTAQFIEEHKAAVTTEGSAKLPRVKHRRPNKKPSAKELANLKPFPKGTSGNPGGQPGVNLAQLYARRFFEQHPNGIDEEMKGNLKDFSAYGYDVLAGHGYGKPKQEVSLSGTVEIVERLKAARKRING